MPLIKPPAKPFPSYKWRWAVLTPTESLNEPPVFLGVLRVFNKFQNYAPSSKEIMDGLAIVQEETHTGTYDALGNPIETSWFQNSIPSVTDRQRIVDTIMSRPEIGLHELTCKRYEKIR